MRLCGRSPKDADPLNPEKILEEYEEELKKVKENYPDLNLEDPNTKFMAFVKGWKLIDLTHIVYSKLDESNQRERSYEFIVHE